MDAPKTPPLDVTTTNKSVQDTTTPDAKPVEGEAKNSIPAKQSVRHNKKKHKKDPKKPKRARSGL